MVFTLPYSVQTPICLVICGKKFDFDGFRTGGVTGPPHCDRGLLRATTTGAGFAAPAGEPVMVLFGVVLAAD